MEKDYLTNLIKPGIAFKGHTISVNEKGEKEYQFYLPTNSNKKLHLQAVLVDEKGATAKYLQPSLCTKEQIPVWTVPVSAVEDRKTLAYRFVNNGKVILDNTIKSKLNNFNEAIKSSRPDLNMPRQMYHLVPDNFNPENGKILFDELRHEVQRNHFNKFGGTLKGVIAKIKEIKDLGARRIISTPIFGDDVVSNHGYWTVNPYQITSSIGNINDYKTLQLELFKNGMGWVADGAFANEGIEGIHIQDIMRWGEKSPFANWFDMKDFNQNGIKWGVLPPAGSEAHKHYDFKLINSPLIYSFDKNGQPSLSFGKPNPQYDSTKPTFLQQFDRRLMDEDYINSSKVLHSYTKKQLEDVHTIRNYKDSVQLLTYNVNPQSVEAKIKEMAKITIGNAPDTHSIFREMLTKWDNFALENVDKDGTIRNWTGKKDIVALNYVNKDVQDYIADTAKYWTNETDKVLTTYVAKRLAENSASSDSLKQEIQSIANLFDVNLSEVELNNIISESDYKVSLAPAKNSIKEELKDFPIIASELPREISALFADPAVKNDHHLDAIYEKQIAPLVESEFSKLFKNSSQNGRLTEEGKNIFRLVSSDIMRYITAYAFAGEAPKVEMDDTATKIVLPENFSENVFKNVRYQSATRQEAIDKTFYTFKHGVKKLSKDSTALNDLSAIIFNNTKGLDLNLIKSAKTILLRLEAGLEWRIDASKDIMDLDQILQGKAAETKMWAVVQNFWKRFNNTVREYNPKSYIIGEVTCLWDYFKNNADNVEKEFIKNTGFTTQTNYSHIFNIMNQIVHGAPEVGMFHGEHHSSIKDLTSNLKRFFDSGFADNINFSHEGVGNQDKPRALHGYAVNIADFFGQNIHNYDTLIAKPEFVSVARVIKESNDFARNKNDREILEIIKNGDDLFTNNDIRKNLLEKDSSRKLFSEFKNNLEVIKSAIADKKGVNAVKMAMENSLDEVQKKFHLNDEQMIAIKSAINDYADGKVSVSAEAHYKVKPYNYTIDDVLKRADLNLSDDLFKLLSATMHQEMLKPAFSKYKAMLQVLVALPGNPTVYAGDEYGETGFETPGNYVYQHNRHQIHRNWTNDSNKPEFRKFHDEFKKIFNLRNKKCFSPFVNGETIVLDNFACDNIGGVYRYNKDRDVIAVFNTNGFDNTRAASAVSKINVNSIPVKADFDITRAYGSDEFVRIGYNGEMVEGEFYKMINNVLKRFEDASFSKELSNIELSDAATYFARKTAKFVADSVPTVTQALRGQVLADIKHIL